jgi:hypothetical protein
MRSIPAAQLNVLILIILVFLMGILPVTKCPTLSVTDTGRPVIVSFQLFSVGTDCKKVQQTIQKNKFPDTNIDNLLEYVNR